MLQQLIDAEATAFIGAKPHERTDARTLIKALGADTGISKSEVSRICADLDEEVATFADDWHASMLRLSPATACCEQMGRSNARLVSTGSEVLT